jgi:hypothetical protein
MTKRSNVLCYVLSTTTATERGQVLQYSNDPR